MTAGQTVCYPNVCTPMLHRVCGTVEGFYSGQLEDFFRQVISLTNRS